MFHIHLVLDMNNTKYVFSSSKESRLLFNRVYVSDGVLNF